MAITLIDDQSVAGLADRLAELDGVDPDDAATALREHAAAVDLPTPGARGVPDVYRWIVDRIRGRRLTEDLGEHPAQMDWLELHVPPGGSGSISLRDDRSAEQGVKLSIAGLGYGNVRVLRWSVSEDFADRGHCLRLIQHFGVRVRRYDDGETRADLTSLRQLEVQAWDVCPRCGGSADALDPFSYEAAGRGIDLSGHDDDVERGEHYELSGTTDNQIGLAIPLTGGSSLNAGVSARSTVTLGCDTRYRFAPGRHYTPVRAVGRHNELPFWALGPWPFSTS
jgi:hypothetical protein